MPALPTQQGRLVLADRPFSPKDLPGLALWLDASQITGLSDGDPVATWSDLSGLGNHATQATGSKRPTYKVNIVNGRPVVRFDGVDDVLSVALPASMQVDSWTYVAVVKATTSGAAASFIDMGDVAVADQTIGKSATDTLRGVSYRTDGTQNDVPTGATPIAGAFGVFTARRSTADNAILVRVNGTQDAIDSSLVGVGAGYGTTKVVAIGGRATTQFLAGDMYAALAWPRDLSTAEMLKVERYLGALTGVAVA